MTKLATCDDESLFRVRGSISHSGMSTYYSRQTMKQGETSETRETRERERRERNEKTPAQNILSNNIVVHTVIYVIEITRYIFAMKLNICIMWWGNYCLTSMNCCWAFDPIQPFHPDWRWTQEVFCAIRRSSSYHSRVSASKKELPFSLYNCVQQFPTPILKFTHKDCFLKTMPTQWPHQIIIIKVNGKLQVVREYSI